MSVHLNRKELKLLKALDQEYPGGVERTKNCFKTLRRLKSLALQNLLQQGLCSPDYESQKPESNICERKMQTGFLGR